MSILFSRWRAAAAVPALVLFIGAAGGNARIDFTDVNAAQLKQPGTPFADGSYMLYRGATKEYLIVNTKEKQYAEMGMDQLMQLTSAITQLIHMEMTNVHIDAESVQPDTTVDGYKTQHWRITQQYHSKMSVAFIHHKATCRR